MKASELIKSLATLMSIHGDCEVMYEGIAMENIEEGNSLISDGLGYCVHQYGINKFVIHEFQNEAYEGCEDEDQ